MIFFDLKTALPPILGKTNDDHECQPKRSSPPRGVCAAVRAGAGAAHAGEPSAAVQDLRSLLMRADAPMPGSGHTGDGDFSLSVNFGQRRTRSWPRDGTFAIHED